MKIEVEESRSIEPGRHPAQIHKLEEREEPYHYVDVYFELEDAGTDIKMGCPAKITKNTRLGKLLETVGHHLKVGNMIDLGEVLVGKKVWLQTVNEKTENGVFARVMPESIELRA